MEKCDVFIIGGGVIGCAIAYRLAQRGKKVVLAERDTIGAHASSAAAGMLGAQVEFAEPGSLVELSLKSRQLFPALSRELYEKTGVDIQLNTSGILRVTYTEKEKAKLLAQAEWQSSMGEAVEWLETDQIRALEPAVTSEILGGLSIPHDYQVSSPHLTKAFAQAAALEGAELIEHCEVEEIVREQEHIIGVKTSRGVFPCDDIVLAAGAWSGVLARRFGIDLPVEPIKGECFSVIAHKLPIKRTIFSHGCYVVPKSGGRMIIGASVKEAGFDKRLTLDGIQKLTERAVRLIPELKNYEMETMWASLRPQTQNMLPFLGRHSTYKNLVLATGHYRNGILLSPITGEIVSQLIMGEPLAHPIESFHGSR